MPWIVWESLSFTAFGQFFFQMPFLGHVSRMEVQEMWPFGRSSLRWPGWLSRLSELAEDDLEMVRERIEEAWGKIAAISGRRNSTDIPRFIPFLQAVSSIKKQLS